ncbi:ankyrin repeat-containing domain protein [Morchella snyderi]|nr:ankyrin repeat-containing domain protein [Morchella snyderi]
MPLSALAAELLFLIADELSLHDVASILPANHHLNSILTPYLYTRAKTLLVPRPPRDNSPDPEPLLNSLARRGHTRPITHLLHAGASSTSGAPPALYTAAEVGRAEVVSLMAAHHIARAGGVAIHVACQTYNEGRSPLHVAVERGHDAVVRALLEAGFSVMQQTEGGATPLELAVRNAHVQVMRTLLEDGASPNVPVGRIGNTVVTAARSKLLIHWVVENASALSALRGMDLLPVLRLLLDYRADIHSRDGYRATPLHIAAKCGEALSPGMFLLPESLKARGRLARDQITSLLIERGADCNARDQGGKTPLHNAVESQNVGLVRMLLEAGADKEVMSWAGKTPVMLASTRGWVRTAEVVKLLEDWSIGAGASVKRE